MTYFEKQIMRYLKKFNSNNFNAMTLYADVKRTTITKTRAQICQRLI